MKSLKIAGALCVLTVMAGCVPDWARENETNLLMTIAKITGSPGGTGAEVGDILFSDVSQWINDDAVVTVSLFRKNPTVVVSTPLEDVRLDSYSVRYFRTDGHSVEGLDVPHRITGPLNSVLVHAPTITGESTADVVINVVRHTAKREAPLINLIDTDLFPNGRSLLLTGNGIITTVAEITVYGRQVTSGDAISATGSFQVAFADFADQ
jgi:hypothetical protein